MNFGSHFGGKVVLNEICMEDFARTRGLQHQPHNNGGQIITCFLLWGFSEV